MSFFSTFTATLMVLGAITASDATEHVQRKLILGGKENPIGTKLYMVGLRSTMGESSFCGGVLISPFHVLSTASCATLGVAKFAAIGTHYINGTKDGEVIPIKSIQNHTRFNVKTTSYDFAILTLEKSSRILPVKLPKANDADIVVGMSSMALGWGMTDYPNSIEVSALQFVDLTVWSNKDCKSFFFIDESNVCAGGVAKEDTCVGDNGGPLLRLYDPNDTDDVVIGLTSWGYRCGLKGYPSVYSRVSAALPWINMITKGEGTRQ